MTQEPAAWRALGQDRANRSHYPADRRAHAVEGLLSALDDVFVVAGKQLVAAVAGEYDLDVFRGELRDHVGRDRGGITKRFVEIPRQVLDEVDDIGPENQLVVFGVERRS